MTGVTPPRTRPLPTIASSLSLLLSRLGLASTVPADLRYEDGLQARQTIDALGVLARPVGGHLRLPLAPGRFDQLLAGTHKVHERNTEPARARHPVHRDVYDGPRPGQAVTQSVVRLVFGFVNRALAVETHYPRRVAEGGEHQRDAAGRSEGGYRFHAPA